MFHRDNSRSQRGQSRLHQRLVSSIGSPVPRRRCQAADNPIKTDGEEFFTRLAESSFNPFSQRFVTTSTSMGLGLLLSGHELDLLYEATLHATLCQISFNGLGGCGGEIKPEREIHRSHLEWEFMAVRDELYHCAGWRWLPQSTKDSIQRVFFRIFVTEENLAA